MEKNVESCPGGHWFDSRGVHNRAQASVDRDCKNLLGSEQTRSRARILGGAGAENTQPPHPNFTSGFGLNFGSAHLSATYLKDVLSGVSQNEVSFGKNDRR